MVDLLAGSSLRHLPEWPPAAADCGAGTDRGETQSCRTDRDGRSGTSGAPASTGDRRGPQEGSDTNAVVPTDLAARLCDVVRPTGLVDDPVEMSTYLSDWHGAYRGSAAVVVRPGSTEEVAAVVARCREAGVALVP